jgi:YD repeat-containing protein
MQRLTILHETRYTYGQPVSFTPHQLLLRPRDSHALRLINASLELSPPGDVRWTYDALGNCVCEFSPQGAATSLVITSTMTVDRYPAHLEQKADDPHSPFPIVYGPVDRVTLAPFVLPETEDEAGVMVTWLRKHIGAVDEPVLTFVQRLNEVIHRDFSYAMRYAEGVQHPVETLHLGSGSCRDFAWLMVEALRRMGVAARFVTGYIYSSTAELRGTGATHAWCEVFLPGLGWTEFDPTNNLMESADLIPIAVARTPAEASPISGALIGYPGNSHLDVTVEVHLVSEEDTLRAA